VAGAAGAPQFGNPDRPPEGKINDKSPTGLDDPGPQNQALASQFPNFQDPPATDVNGMQRADPADVRQRLMGFLPSRVDDDQLALRYN
jgi:hypothetical protein